MAPGDSDNKHLLRIKELEDSHSFGLVGTYVLDFKNEIVYGDKTLCTMYKLTYSPVGVPLSEFLLKIHPEDRISANKIRQKNIAKNIPYEVEYRVQAGSNEWKWMLVRAKVRYTGTDVFYDGIVIDITERKLAESAFNHQSYLMRTLTNNATSALLMMNNEGYCTFMNSAAIEMFGYTFEEITAQPLHFMIHHHRADGTPYPLNECPINKALQQNFEIRAHEDVYFKKDGTSFPVMCAASPIFENDIPVSTVIEVRDITDQKKAEETLQQYAENQALLNSVGKAISEDLDIQNILQKVTDTTTKLTGAAFGAFFYNVINEKGESFMLYTLSGAPKEAFERFGMPRNTAVFHTTFSGEGISRVDDITKDPRYGKSAPHYGMPKGHLPVVSYLSVPVISKSGNVIGGLFFGHPKKAMFTLTHEKLISSVASQAAIALDNAKMYEEIKILNAKKDEFIGLASHELKTPLTSMLGYLQLLERTESNSTNQTFLKKTIEKTKKLTALVNELLDISKIESGKLQMNFDTFDFMQTLREAVEIATSSATDYQVNVYTSYHSLSLHADQQRIEQVLINLLTNAIKYSPNTTTIDILVTVGDTKLKVGIKDYGIGIDKAKQEHIFSRFYRVDDLNPNISGLGIGLYICKEIIDRHHGSIWVESESGQGSTFYFTLNLSN